ncbi:hypothetical protein P280DRAFT_507661 [Massarina eburnea CBS 473.64]|uniref:DUF7029 domain-containing protein n=1 Tax=Massarina eburnea CBS 473.64 TaxID=1395130 RepID=A0A6A6RX11_9PLEO|nr:hypothetical protein P280DRAFT_507661 [Massarina eburnea CBS 473.64]
MGVFSKICAIAMVAGFMGVEAATPVEAPERTLRAATRRSDLMRRSMKIEPKFESEVVYVESESGYYHKNVFASQVKVASKKPILNLEEIEHHLSDVRCSDDKMTLSFRDPKTARDAKAAAHGTHGGLIISAHEGCNPEGERTVYNVNSLSHPDEGSYLEISVKQGDWEDSFDRIVVDFGHTEEVHKFRKHSHFRRAEDDKLDIPAFTIPTNTSDNVLSTTFTLDWMVEDTTFSLEDFLPVTGTTLPNQAPLEIGCNSCSLIGSLVLSAGSIDIDSSEIDLIPDVLQGGDDGKDMSKVIKGGFMELAAQGVEGYFEFFTKPTSSGSFMIKLMTLPVLGFSIPGIGKAGAFLETVLSADYDIQGAFEMTYGFQLSVPDNSTIRVDLTDPSKSGVVGFKDAELTAIPFLFEQKEVSAFVSLALLPSIPIGFKFKKLVDVSVEVDMELPRVDALITTIANADTNCNDLDAVANATLAKRSDNSTTPADNSTTAVGDVEIGALVHIETNISMSINAGFNLMFPGLDAVGLSGTSQSAEIFSTLIALPTLCLAPEAGWAPATEVYDAVGTMAPVASAIASTVSVGYSDAMPTGSLGYSGVPASESVVGSTSAYTVSTAVAAAGSTSTSCTESVGAASSSSAAAGASSYKVASASAPVTTSAKPLYTATGSAAVSTSTSCTESEAASTPAPVTTSAKPLSTPAASATNSTSTSCTESEAAAASQVARDIYGIAIPSIPNSLTPNQLTALIPSSIPSNLASKYNSLTALIPSLTASIPTTIPTSAIQSKASSIQSKVASKVESKVQSQIESVLPTPSPFSAATTAPPKVAPCDCATSIVTVTLPSAQTLPKPSANATVPLLSPTGTGVPLRNNGTGPSQTFAGKAAERSLSGVVVLGVVMGALVVGL